MLRSSKVDNHIHKPFVNNAFDWLLLVQGPIRGFVYTIQLVNTDCIANQVSSS
jgi:hypothetical protein